MPQGKVISLDMKATEMGNRGSKSEFVCKRATSRRFFNFIVVRYTLVVGKPVIGRNPVDRLIYLQSSPILKLLQQPWPKYYLG